MNYASHSLRTNLQEWKNRLYKATYKQFEHQLKYLLDNIKNNKQLKSLIHDSEMQYIFSKEEFDMILNSRWYQKTNFENSTHQAFYSYQFLNYFIEKIKGYKVINHLSGSFDEKKLKLSKTIFLLSSIICSTSSTK